MRYQYPELYKEIGEKGQKALEKKTVTVVGIGGVGSAVSQALAGAGINLRLVDKDRIYEQDLHRLSLFGIAHIDKFKAKEAKKILEDINPHVKVKTFHEELMDTNTFLLEGDVVLDLTNELKSSRIINKHCKRPLIVCRYSGDEGIIFHKTAKLNVEKLKAKLEKQKGVKEAGIFSPVVYLAAAIVLSETIKVLLKKKQTTGMITFNAWTNSVKIVK
jgi:molybdopterin/thiamine biosynthesis adenylyltransferase